MFSFGEILHRGDNNKTNVTYTKVFFEKNGQNSPNFEELFFKNHHI
jgi:hypothetical protein